MPGRLTAERVDARELVAVITERLHIKPKYIVEWKQLLRDAGVVELAVEPIGPDGDWIEHSRLRTAVRGWRVAGWSGVRFALSKSYTALRKLVSSRTLGLSLIWGSKWTDDQ